MESVKKLILKEGKAQSGENEAQNIAARADADGHRCDPSCRPECIDPGGEEHKVDVAVRLDLHRGGAALEEGVMDHGVVLAEEAERRYAGRDPFVSCISMEAVLERVGVEERGRHDESGEQPSAAVGQKRERSAENAGDEQQQQVHLALVGLWKPEANASAVFEDAVFGETLVDRRRGVERGGRCGTVAYECAGRW